MKTADLKGAALDWAVAKCEGWSDEGLASIASGDEYPEHAFSTDWSQGGPIIEREDISIVKLIGALWGATTCPVHQIYQDRTEAYFQGSGLTPLIAAMRCFVVSKLGDEVELPEELK